MMFQRINRSDPEKVFIVVKNGYTTASLTNGQAVGWDLGDADGVSVSKLASTYRGASFAGIVAETIASGEYGLLQVWGYHSAVIVDASTTQKTIITGSPLFARIADFYLKNWGAASHATDQPVIESICGFAAIAFSTYTLVGTTGTIKAFVKAL